MTIGWYTILNYGPQNSSPFLMIGPTTTSRPCSSGAPHPAPPTAAPGVASAARRSAGDAGDRCPKRTSRAPGEFTKKMLGKHRIKMVLRCFNMVLSCFNMVWRIFNMVLRCFNMVLRIFDMVLRCFNMVLRIFDMVLRIFDMVLRCFNMVLRCCNMVLRCCNMVWRRFNMALRCFSMVLRCFKVF